MPYNDSNTNKANGAIVYVKNKHMATTKITPLDKTKILEVEFNCENNEKAV